MIRKSSLVSVWSRDRTYFLICHSYSNWFAAATCHFLDSFQEYLRLLSMEKIGDKKAMRYACVAATPLSLN